MKIARILATACLATITPQALFGQVSDERADQHVFLVGSDGSTFSLTSSAVRIDGGLCVPLTDLAKALHGAPDLPPSLTLEGSTLRVVGPPGAEADEYWPINRMQTEQGIGAAPARLGVRRAGLISNRIRIV